MAGVGRIFQGAEYPSRREACQARHREYVHSLADGLNFTEPVNFSVYGGLEVGGDSVGVGGGELGEGLFPVGGGVSLDEAGVSCSFVGGFSCVCEALGGAFVFDVADGEP